MGGHSACGCDSGEYEASRAQKSTGEEESTAGTHREKESQDESQEQWESNCKHVLAQCSNPPATACADSMEAWAIVADTALLCARNT